MGAYGGFRPDTQWYKVNVKIFITKAVHGRY